MKFHRKEMSCVLPESLSQGTFGAQWSFKIKNHPQQLASALSRYSFAAKIIGDAKSVLEMGCGEGMGAQFLTQRIQQYTGVDSDLEAIENAQSSFSDDRYTFIYDDFMGNKYGTFDSVVSFGALECIHRDYQKLYFDTIALNLSSKGICVVGTSVRNSHDHSQKELVGILQNYFNHVYVYGMNEGGIYVDYEAMAPYTLCFAFSKKILC